MIPGAAKLGPRQITDQVTNAHNIRSRRAPLADRIQEIQTLLSA